MQPKFKWVLNVFFFFLTMAIGGVAAFLCRFLWAQIVMGIVFYGGLGYLFVVTRRAHRPEKPPRRFNQDDLWRFAGLGVIILVCTLAVVLVGTSLTY